MSLANRASVELRFQDGTVFRAVERFSLREEFADPIGEMSFTARPVSSLFAKYDAQLKKGRLVALLVDGTPQGNHLIQTVKKTISKEGIAWDVTAQSVLCTAYEGSADPDYAFISKTDVPISSVVLDIMRPYGFDQIFVNAEDDVNIRLKKPVRKSKKFKIEIDALKHQDCQVQEGETAYGVIDRIVNRLGLILRSDLDGNLLLCAPRYDQEAAYTLVATFQNTVKGDRMLDPITITDTNTNQFSECVVRGTHADKGGQTQLAQPIARVGDDRPSTDRFKNAPFAKVPRTAPETGRHRYSSPEIAPYKPKFFRDKKCRDAVRAKNLCNLILGMKAKDGYVVQCSVDGFISSTGRVWSIDTVARVVIEADGLDTDMWISERTLEQDREGGQRTTLKLIPKYSLQIGEIPT